MASAVRQTPWRRAPRWLLGYIALALGSAFAFLALYEIGAGLVFVRDSIISSPSAVLIVQGASIILPALVIFAVLLRLVMRRAMQPAQQFGSRGLFAIIVARFYQVLGPRIPFEYKREKKKKKIGRVPMSKLTRLRRLRALRKRDAKRSKLW